MAIVFLVVLFLKKKIFFLTQTFSFNSVNFLTVEGIKDILTNLHVDK